MQSTPAILEAFLAATNRHEVERLLELLAPEFRYRDAGGAWSFERAQMEDLYRWDAELGSRLGCERSRVSGDEATGSFRERNELLRLLGIPERRFALHFRVRDGLIAEQVCEVLPQVGTSDEEALGPVLAWARREREGVLAELLPEGRMRMDAACARGWLALLREWRALDSAASNAVG